MSWSLVKYHGCSPVVSGTVRVPRLQPIRFQVPIVYQDRWTVVFRYRSGTRIAEWLLSGANRVTIWLFWGTIRVPRLQYGRFRYYLGTTVAAQSFSGTNRVPGSLNGCCQVSIGLSYCCFKVPLGYHGCSTVVSGTDRVSRLQPSRFYVPIGY